MIEEVIICWELVFVAIATGLIEILLFFLCGFRRFRECGIFFLVNFVSNILLNEFIGQLPYNTTLIPITIISEIFIVILEYLLMRYVIEYKERKLLLTLCFTNFVTTALGFYIYF